MSSNGKEIVGWICCALALLILFIMVFEVLVKTMFYLEPEKSKNKDAGELTKGFT